MEKLKTYWHNNRLVVSIQAIGLLYFAFYSFLALYFFKERTMSFDSAAFSFELVQTKSFVLPLGRWGSIFSQILPLLALKIGATLATILKAYSFSFIFLGYLGFLIITLVFKNNRVGLIYLLTLCLTFRNTFYFSVSEFAQGLALVIILYAIVEAIYKNKRKSRLLMFLSAVVLIASLYYFHQLLIIAIVFVLLVTIIKNRAYTNVYLLSLLGFAILWFGVKIILLSNSSYEAEKIPATAVFIKEMPHFFDLPSFKYFFNHFKNEFFIPAIISLIACLILLFKKRGLLLLLFIGYPIAYFVLIIITYYKGEAPNMYQQYYIMFGLFLALLMDVVRKKNISLNYLLLIICPVLIYSSQRVYASHKLPTQRVEYINNLANTGLKHKNRKYVIHPDDFPWGYGWVTWAVPSEMLLISSINDREKSVTYYIPAADEIVDLASNNGQLLAAPWQRYLMNTHVLDTNYFNLPTKTAYLLTKRRPRDLYYYKEKIRYDFMWMKEIERKAASRGISMEDMIQIDALYTLDNTPVSKLEQVQILKSKREIEELRKQKILSIETRIRNDTSWIELIKAKAIMKDISVDEMVKIDAEYIFINEK